MSQSNQLPSARDRRRARLWGVAATVAFHLLLLAVLAVTVLVPVAVDDPERGWPPTDEHELLYAGQYVKIGNQAQAREAVETEVAEGYDPVDAGTPADQSVTPVTQTAESPVTTDTPPAPAGPTQAELEEQERVRRQQEASERINKRVAFGSGSSATATDNGSPQGNAEQGAASGAPGTDLAGRTLASWATPSGRATGTIVIEVGVNRKGKVVSARYVSGSGPVAGNAKARRSCEQAALQSAFSVSDDAPPTQTGRITYHFK